MTEAELDDIVGRLSGVISFSREQSGRPPAQHQDGSPRTAKEPALAAAKLRLVKSGCKEEAIAKFPVMQVVLLDQKHRYEIERDKRLKLLAVPVWQVQPSFSASSALRLAKWPISSLLPNVDKLRAEWRSSSGRSRSCGTSRRFGSMPRSTTANYPPWRLHFLSRCRRTRSAGKRSPIA